MTAQELIDILSVRYPAENVTLLSEGGKNIQVLGIDDTLSSQYGCIVLKTAWSIGDKPIENEEDRIRRQRDELTRQIARIHEKEKEAKEREAKKKAAAKKAATKKKKKTTRRKKTSTPKEQIENGFIPTGKRGRPRRMVQDTEFIQQVAEDYQLELNLQETE